MKVVFDRFDFYVGTFFGVLNGKKIEFNITVKNKAHAKKILNQYKHYDKAYLLVPGLKGFENWNFGDETTLTSPFKWEIHEEKLHLSNNAIKGKILAETNFTLEFSNIKNKKCKTKNYSVQIIFYTNIYEDENTINPNTLYNAGISKIFIKGNSRIGYEKNEENNHIYSLLERATIDIESGEVSIHPYANKKESFYTYDFGGFISNQKIVDEIYDMFIYVCNLLAIDSKEHYLDLKNKLNALNKGI